MQEPCPGERTGFCALGVRSSRPVMFRFGELQDPIETNQTQSNHRQEPPDGVTGKNER